jgi:hypothetical protein
MYCDLIGDYTVISQFKIQGGFISRDYSWLFPELNSLSTNHSCDYLNSKVRT